jgi:hypothetical protein
MAVLLVLLLVAGDSSSLPLVWDCVTTLLLMLLLAIVVTGGVVNAGLDERLRLLLLFLSPDDSLPMDETNDTRLKNFFFLWEVDHDDVLCFLAMEGRDGKGAGAIVTNNQRLRQSTMKMEGDE